MNLKLLAQNIRQFRTAKKLSQIKLAAKSGLSLPTIKNLEGGKKAPRVETLQAITNVLGIKLQELFLVTRALESVRFRSDKKMRSRENILAKVTRWLDDFNYLEEVTSEKVPYKLEGIRNQTREKISKDDIIHFANSCRKELSLNLFEPIYDICGLLESAGIKVLPIDVEAEGFFGLSVGAQDGGHAVVVNVCEKIPVERRIFSAAHELGHLLMHCDSYNKSLTEEDEGEEEQANIFAGRFLMPNDGFSKEFDATAGLFWIDRILKIKHIFHVSYKTVICRLIERGIADNSIWQKFYTAYQKHYKKKLLFTEEPNCPMTMTDLTEPDSLPRFDFFEGRLSRLVKKAIDSEKISISRGAEILSISIEDMRERLDGLEIAV